MNFPEDLKHAKSHEWVKTLEDDTVLVGVSDYVQDALGDLVFANPPEVGDGVTEGEPFVDVESVKAVSDAYSPVSGTVAEINEVLLNALESINEVPYEAWFMKVENVTGITQLMNTAEYEECVKTLDQGTKAGKVLHPMRDGVRLYGELRTRYEAGAAGDTS